jgi:putative hydrolase of the HAD superfamily
MTKLIIFDIGGVIEDFAEQDYINYICAKLNLNKKEFGDELLRMLPSAEEGRISTREMLDRVALGFGVSAGRLEWSGSISKLARIDKNVASLVNRLGGKYRVVLLTNVSKSRYIENVRMGFFKRVKVARTYASCYLGMSKPMPQIYRYVLEKEHVKPQDAVFVDNLRINVEGARRVGINGVYFTSYRRLVNDLKKLGIRW